MNFKQKSVSGFAEGDWKVSVTTEESGKHGNVVMVAYGDKGNSGQIMLGKCGNKKLFNAGNVDEFKVCCQPLSLLFQHLYRRHITNVSNFHFALSDLENVLFSLTF